MVEKSKKPAPKYLDSESRFGFMSRGIEASCKILRCTIPSGASRLYDNVYKVGPICLKCARNALDGKAEPTELADTVDNLALRIKRLEDFFKGSGAWQEHVKTWKVE